MKGEEVHERKLIGCWPCQWLLLAGRENGCCVRIQENTQDSAPEQTLLSLSEVHTNREGQRKVQTRLTSHLILNTRGGVNRCVNLILALSTNMKVTL